MEIDEAVGAGQHVVQFYEREETLALAVSSFLGAGLVAGEAVLVVAMPAHREAFEAVMHAAGINVGAARAAGQYVALDAADTLATFIVDGRPDPGRFHASVGGLIGRTAADGAIRVYGEMVAILWDAGNVMGAIELEALWNDQAGRQPFSLYCAYPMQAMAGTPSGHDLICQHHSTVIPDPELPSVSADRAEHRFEPTIFAPQAARAFVSTTLDRWRLDHLKHDAALIVSELAANAAVHVGHRFSVEVLRLDEVIRLEVVDQSMAVPMPRPESSSEATSGRGMHLVDAVAQQWGTEVRHEGKTVWAEIAL